MHFHIHNVLKVALNTITKTHMERPGRMRRLKEEIK
jgi:hypothetical protein